MIAAVIITGDRCPDCDTELSSLPEEEPWCSSCEWNLDHYVPSRAHGWFARRIRSADHAAGFRSGLRLAQSTGESPVGAGRYLVLVMLSAVLVLLMLAAVAAGVWLIAVHGRFLPVLPLGALLIWLGVLIRPRFGRLRPLLEGSFPIDDQNAPALLGLIARIARELDAPMPDRVLVDFDLNASVTTVRLRRTRVLILGVPLLLALRPPQLVALLAHELGHLKYADNRRLLLTQPARRTFGVLSRAADRPPRSARIIFGLVPFLLTPWELFGGILSWLLWQVHLGVNVLVAGDDRTVELRADAAAVRVAGTAAVLEMLDVLARTQLLVREMRMDVRKGEAAVIWRRRLLAAQTETATAAPVWRQLSIRTDASLFASHPAPGRRHQWISARAVEPGMLSLDEHEATLIDAEIVPFADYMHRHWIALSH